MPDVGVNPELQSTTAHNIVYLTLLVGADGAVIGGIPPASAASLPAHVLDVLCPYSGIPVESWWPFLRGRTDASSDYRTVALLKQAGEQHLPVMLCLSRLPGRAEYLVACYELGYRRLSLAKTLHTLALAIAQLDLDGVLATVQECILPLMPSDSFYIALYDAETEQVHIREIVDGGKPEVDVMRPLAGGLTGWVIQNRRSLIIHNIHQDDLPVPYVQHGTGPVSQSVLLVPLMVQDKMLGALSVQSNRPDAYTDEDLWLLDAIAGQTAVAIYNAHLYEETASRLATLSALQRVTLQLTTGFEVQQVAEVISAMLADLLGPDEVRVYLRSQPEAGPILYVTGLAGGQSLTADDVSAADGFLLRVDANGESLILDVAGDDPGLVAVAGWHPASLAVCPIWRGAKRFGVFALLYRAERFFREEDRRMLSLLSQQSAIAIENAYYHTSLVQQVEEVSALVALAQQITGQLDSEQILQLVVETMRDIFHCRACVIALRDEQEPDMLAIRAAAGLKQRWQDAARWRVGEGIAGQVVATGQTLYVPDVYADTSMPVFDPDVRSVIAVPITFQGRTIGSMNLDSQQAGAFSPTHERILTIAAAQVAAALENARLYRAEAERAEALTAMNVELHNLDKVREELIQNLAHELRTPLTYIKGYSSLLLDEELGALVDEQRDALQIVADKTLSIQRLITDVVDLEQINADTLSREMLDANQLARQSFEASRMFNQANALHFELSLAEADLWVYGDRGRLGQVLDNLLNNAVKFTPEGGTISLQTRLSADEQFIEIRVADTGIGIAPAYLARIFERFYQVKDPARRGTGGSGIGLALVQRTIDAHEGRIHVESEKGKGSAFTVTLPLRKRPVDGDA